MSYRFLSTEKKTATLKSGAAVEYALVTLNSPPMNALASGVFHDLDNLITELESAKTRVAIITGAGKAFVAGADISEMSGMTVAQAKEYSELGHRIFSRMEASPVIFIAAVNGFALGGGLELAMAADIRIFADTAQVGLPEPTLGLIPGFGGTQNLFPLVGLQNAMDMMLTGKEIRPSKAKKMGLVDLVVAPQSLESVAIQQAEQLALGKLKIQRKPKSFVNRLLEDNSIGQNIIWKQIDKMVQKNTNGNYPAPYAIIECVKNGLQHPKGNDKYKFEREQFAKLAATPESAALIGIFDGMTSMKKHAYGENVARPVRTVTVLGAGLMGAGIAQVTAEKGYRVNLKDRNDEAVGRGLSYMQDNWNKKVTRQRMTEYQRNVNSSNVVGLHDDMPACQQHLAKTDLIIEAVFENLELKQKIVADMEAICSEDAIFASNTSAIPIAKIAEGAKRPENIIGMHYFSPVPSMPLLEIIPHTGTSDAAIATAYEVGAKQGKTCIVVKDVPGFYVNRCLGPYLVEVSALLKDGVQLEALDKAVTKFGMPVGPITLADEVGLDVASHVATFLSKADLGVRMGGGDVSLMATMVEKGWLGKKSSQGFYTYGKGKQSKKTINPEVQSYVKNFATRDLKLSEKEIQDRIVSRFVNEAAKCLEDEIIASPVTGDIGLVFGTGFAPFRGGPFRYLDQVGVRSYVDLMNGFADKYGPQFEPCQLLKDYAAADRKFHSK